MKQTCGCQRSNATAVSNTTQHLGSFCKPPSTFAIAYAIHLIIKQINLIKKEKPHEDYEI